MSYRVLSNEDDPRPDEVVFECADDACVAASSSILRVYGGFLAEVVSTTDPVAIPCPEFSSQTVLLFLKWAAHHADPANPPPVIERPLNPSEPLVKSLGPFDGSFLYGDLISLRDETDNVALLEVLRLAFFFDVEPLQHLACAALADLIKTRETEEDMRALFRIPEPFTAADWSALEKDVPWAFDDPSGAA
eukprot:TRINITY_DN1423_c0_g2_i5.p1 TRINITY_DN1423_c0_g2~~TRINITY_DN1423_c0_g2_i5.p1  ORF type:complete len:191 (-),score=18.16 TRINITY_DN1423_c0_g2_i5:237-809(-)